MHNFQKDGAISNTQAGNDFESETKAYFASRGIVLEEHVALDIGIEGKVKRHKFDLGSTDPGVVVECKSHTWTETDSVPVAKMATWTEAMYYFYASPNGYRNVFFVLKDFSEKHRETLAQRTIFGHTSTSFPAMSSSGNTILRRRLGRA